MCVKIFITKVDILSFVTPKYRTLVPAIGLIYILQLGTLNESVFLPVLGFALFGAGSRGPRGNGGGSDDGGD